MSIAGACMINIRIVRMLFISAVAYWKGDTVVSDAVAHFSQYATA